MKMAVEKAVMLYFKVTAWHLHEGAEILVELIASKHVAGAVITGPTPLTSLNAF
jgi:hypothetical protein